MHRRFLVTLAALLVLASGTMPGAIASPAGAQADGAPSPQPAVTERDETVITFVGPVGARDDDAFLVEVGDRRWRIGPLAGAGTVRFAIEEVATVRLRRLVDCSVWALFTVAPGSHSVVTPDRSPVTVEAGDVSGAVTIGDASSPPAAPCVRVVTPIGSPGPSTPAATGRCARARAVGLDDLRAIPAPWMAALWRAYGTGVSDFSEVATDAAVDQVRALDWRLRAVEDGTGLFAEDAELTLVTSGAGCALRTDGERTIADLEVAIDIAPGAAVIDPATGRVLEQRAGQERRVAAWTFERAAPDAPWVLVGAGRPVDLEPELPIPTAGEPCPRGGGGLGSGAVARRGDPFLARPWCDGGGQGRVVPWGDAIVVDRGLCREDERTPHQLWLGDPAGATLDFVFQDPRPFVRDPQGRFGPAFAIGFDRDARLPADAVSTGLSNGRVTIWTSDSVGPEAVFLRLRGGRVERWPRAPYEVACG